MKVYLVIRNYIAPIGMPIKTLDDEKTLNVFYSKEKAEQYINECNIKIKEYNSLFIEGIKFCFEIGKLFYIEYLKTEKNIAWATNAISDYITAEISKSDKKFVKDLCLYAISIADYIRDNVDFNSGEPIESRFYNCMIISNYTIEELEVL